MKIITYSSLLTDISDFIKDNIISYLNRLTCTNIRNVVFVHLFNISNPNFRGIVWVMKKMNHWKNDLYHHLRSKCQKYCCKKTVFFSFLLYPSFHYYWAVNAYRWTALRIENALLTSSFKTNILRLHICLIKVCNMSSLDYIFPVHLSI